MAAYGSKLIVDGHRSYPVVCAKRPKYTYVLSKGFQRGELARSDIEGLWGTLKSVHREVYHSGLMPSENLESHLAEAAWRWEFGRQEHLLRQNLFATLR